MQNVVEASCRPEGWLIARSKATALALDTHNVIGAFLVTEKN